MVTVQKMIKHTKKQWTVHLTKKHLISKDMNNGMIHSRCQVIFKQHTMLYSLFSVLWVVLMKWNAPLVLQSVLANIALVQIWIINVFN